LPPGFESLPPSNDLKIDMSQIPLIRWKCPPHVRLTVTVVLDNSKTSSKITEIPNTLLIADSIGAGLAYCCWRRK
jgi:hypothetical protein